MPLDLQDSLLRSAWNTPFTSHCLPWFSFKSCSATWMMLLVKAVGLDQGQGCLQNERLSSLISTVPNSSVHFWLPGCTKMLFKWQMPLTSPLCQRKLPRVFFYASLGALNLRGCLLGPGKCKRLGQRSRGGCSQVLDQIGSG